MAFTEKTFSLLRESVKQSMAEDKENNLPSGGVIKYEPKNADYINLSGVVWDALRKSGVCANPISACSTMDEVTAYVKQFGVLTFMYSVWLGDIDILPSWTRLNKNSSEILTTYIPKSVLISVYTDEGPIYDKFGEGDWGIKSSFYVDAFKPFEKIVYDGKNVIVDVRLFDEKQKKIKVKKGMKLGRALRELIPCLTDEHVKNIVNELTAIIAPRYICFTKSHIHTHYRVLSVKQNLNSCMSKAASFYRNTRPDVDVDPEESPEIYYIHPCEAYNNSPNLRLALVSPYHPDSVEYNKPDQYPFVARAICLIDKDGSISYGRSYGLESTREAFRSVFENRGTDGGLLHKIESDEGNYIMPYVDPHNSFSDLGRFFEIDEDGDYEVSHSQGVAKPKDRCYCEHCGEYHNDCDEEDGIWVDALGGYVYGDCQEYYTQPVGRNWYYDKDLCYWSDILDDYVHEYDTVEFITNICSSNNSYGVISTDYIHEDYLEDHDIVYLEEEYKDYRYADRELCTYVKDAGWFMNIHEDDYFVYTIDGEPMLLDDVVYSGYYDGYISSDEAVQNSEGDWVLEDDLEEEENNEQSVKAA